MPNQNQFTIEELVALIEKSASMQALPDDKKAQILELLKNPDSELTRQLYDTLVKEKQSIEENDQKLNGQTAPLMDKIGTDLMAVKTLTNRMDQAEAEAKETQADTKAVEDILKSLEK